MNKFFRQIKEFFFPSNKFVDTYENMSKSVSEAYANFEKFGIQKGQVYLIRLGMYSEEINSYLFENKELISEYFLIEEGDYVQILGMKTPKEELFILFVVYSNNFDKKVGNFLSVNKWPPFKNYEEKIEDSYWKLYKEYRDG